MCLAWMVWATYGCRLLARFVQEGSCSLVVLLNQASRPEKRA